MTCKYKLSAQIWLGLAILAGGLALSSVILVHAQSSAPASGGAASITFPVTELGNCTSQADCKNYCDQTEHMQVCVQFAQQHGLMNAQQAQQAQKFSQSLALGAGPGGCKTPQECNSFCSNISNLQTCIAFAQQHGAQSGQDQNIEDAQKILSYLQSGGKMPGGCTSKDSCEQYCGDFSHAQECITFATKSGVGPPPDAVGPDGKPLSTDQMQKMAALMSSGQTPGGCQSKDQCDTYCKDPGHFQECISFAQKAGFITPDQAAMAQKTGGKGPGGCDSKESCDAFCNQPANRETCFSFAKDNGLIPQDQLQQMQQGMVRLRQGLENAPPEVVSCLKSTLGPNIISDIQSGNLVPGPDIGDKVQGCFQKFGQNGSPQAGFENAPPEVKSCLQSKLGADFDKITSGQEQPTPEQGDTMRVCFQSVQFQSGQGGPGQSGGQSPQQFQNFLQSAPPEVTACLKDKVGGDLSNLQPDQLSPNTDTGEKIRSCFEQFRPRQEMQGPGPQGQPQGQNQMMGPQQMMGGQNNPGGLPLQGQRPQNEIRGEFPNMQPGQQPPSGTMPFGPGGQMPGQPFMQPGTQQPMQQPGEFQQPPPGENVPPPPMGGDGTMPPPPPPDNTTSPSGSLNPQTNVGFILRTFGPLLGL